MPALLTRWDPISDELAAAIDGRVERLLVGFQITAPPVDALEIAHRMRLDPGSATSGKERFDQYYEIITPESFPPP